MFHNDTHVWHPPHTSVLHQLRVQVGLLGVPADLTYKYEHLGADVAALSALAAGGSSFFNKLKSAARPVVIVGPAVMRRSDREAVLKSVHELVEKAGEQSPINVHRALVLLSFVRCPFQFSLCPGHLQVEY